MPKTKAIDIFLQPGEYFCGDKSFRIRTLLGSCVSVTLWHPGAKVGAMSHFLLPSRPKALHQELDGRYGEEALQLMLRDLQKAGIRGRDCEAKIFGGGNMFPKQARNDALIGKKNGEAANRLLALHGISVVSQSLYGDGHRQILFDIATGHVWSRQVPNQPGVAGQPDELLPAKRLAARNQIDS